MPRRNAISKLDKALQEWLTSRLIETEFTDYTLITDEFNQLLAPHGFTVSRTAIYNMGSRLKHRLAAVKEATLSAKLIAKEAADEGADLSGAVNAMLSTEMFGLMVDLKALGDNDDKTARMEMVAKMSKASADLSRASVSQKKYAAQVQDKIDKALQAMEAESKAAGGKGKGLDKATLANVRQVIYGIVT